MGIIRKTQSIQILLNEFKDDSSAISVIELIDRLGSQLNKTTIYRVLDKLEDDGVVHSFLGKNGNKWYAKCKCCTKSEHSDMHPHFQCIVCDKVDCLTIGISLPKITNRQVLSSQLLIQGKCEACC